jgi:hypothetical protein
MTAFTTADLPTGANAITTIEELHAWATLVLGFNNATLQYREGENIPNLFRAIHPQLRIPSGELVVINRVALNIRENQPQTAPQWKRVAELSNTTIPAGFRAGLS